MTVFNESISEFIWQTKYRYAKEESIESTWRRVAKAIAQGEPSQTRLESEKDFYSILENFAFLPGGRILAGAGTTQDVTLFNCFVMPISDSLPGIFDALKEAAITLQAGGGVGYDFSPLRPLGFAANQTGATASGPLSFMRIWNAMCGTMLSTSARRGAMMGVLRCDHPDIEAFVTAKSDSNELRHFNVSVLVTDEFMEAVKTGAEWNLVFPNQEIIKRINASELWEKIIHSAYNFAEPGVIFQSTVNRFNNLWYKERICATNPCGEIPLPPYGACNLGSINLTQFIIQPYSKEATVDWKKLERVTVIATRFLDNVINVSKFPLKIQHQEELNTRRIGLGITGLGDLLVMLGFKYGSPESLDLARRLMQLICETTWRTSIELAKERGSFLFYEKENYLKGKFVETLAEDIKNDIAKFGIRNSHHNTIAPAGTISLLANNISNGVEPIFSGEYERVVHSAHHEVLKFKVKNYALNVWRDHSKDKNFPPAWIDTETLQPSAHLYMQAAVQPFIDNAISKTINIPVDFPFEQLKKVYTEAYTLGLKGCTVFRPNPVTGSILKTLPKEDDEVDRCCPHE